ncbi:MAG: GlmU family protein, partial [Bacteroidota bacterium]
MNYILSDGNNREALFPFTFTRPVADMRQGILTLREKWEWHLGTTTSTLTVPYLQEKFPLILGKENIVINGSYPPTAALVKAILNLKLGEVLLKEDDVVAVATSDPLAVFKRSDYEKIKFSEPCEPLVHPWEIFSKNHAAITADFELLTKGKTSQPISGTNTVLGDKSKIFLAEGAKVECSILNTTDGPIYIGESAEIMEGCSVRGPFALCHNAVLKMGARIYTGCTFGPYCKVGGEVNNAVLFAYSNKGHDGFLGNSVIGEWCNLGADTNTSNLKNNYADVKLWDYQKEGFKLTGLQFCGLMMGDHSKCGINTMFNTGTVVGVSANIFGSGFPRNFIPSFSWGGAAGLVTYQTRKALDASKAMMERRGMALDKKEQAILEYVFELTKKWRR